MCSFTRNSCRASPRASTYGSGVRRDLNPLPDGFEDLDEGVLEAIEDVVHLRVGRVSGGARTAIQWLARIKRPRLRAASRILMPTFRSAGKRSRVAGVLDELDPDEEAHTADVADRRETGLDLAQAQPRLVARGRARSRRCCPSSICSIAAMPIAQATGLAPYV